MSTIETVFNPLASAPDSVPGSVPGPIQDASSGPSGAAAAAAAAAIPGAPAPEEATAAPTYPPAVITLSRSGYIIRPMVPADAASMQVACDSPAMAQYMSYRFSSPYTLEAAHHWIGFASAFRVPGPAGETIATAGDVAPIMVISDPKTHAVVGGIGVKTKEDVEQFSFEVGYWTAEPIWGKGVMTEACQAYCKWVFETYPKVIRLSAEVFGGNDASIRVLEKSGFVREGLKRNGGVKHGRVFDVHLFGLLREECTW
ncbi:acyl-CoA N-acyltransferase [Chaetomium sp. MPI-SDFR-AT-0129]|nr:acyl-CoA N-acyltransferase [Chaetomium sp. MPI-SDFR-AT-0129]